MALDEEQIPLALDDETIFANYGQFLKLKLRARALVIVARRQSRHARIGIFDPTRKLTRKRSTWLIIKASGIDSYEHDGVAPGNSDGIVSALFRN